MDSLIIYSIEVALSLALFYLAYWLLLKKDTFFNLNRFYLITSVFVSLFIPLLNIDLSDSAQQNSFFTKYLIAPVKKYEHNLSISIGKNYNPTMDGDYLRDKDLQLTNAELLTQNDEQIITVEATATAVTTNKVSSFLPFSSNIFNFALIIYLTGACIFLLRFVINFGWLFKLIVNHSSEQIGKLKIVRSEKNISPFSFLNYVFISEKDYPSSELSKIITHEKVHVQQKHSLDLVMFELLLVFQWFNPFVWLYKRAIRINHEYLADQETLNTGVDMEEYQYSMLHQVLRDNNFEMASNYNSYTKKRITMMLKKRSPKMSVLKMVLALPIFILLFGAFAFSEIKTNNNAKIIAGTASNNKIKALKEFNVSPDYLKLIEGEYYSTNETGKVRHIILSEVMGTMHAHDNGYTYKLIPTDEGKFVNPDDGGTLVFDTKNKSAITLVLAEKINLNKKTSAVGEYANRSMAFSLVKVGVKDGAKAIPEFYQLRKDSSNYYVINSEINFAGYQLLGAKKFDEAAAVFKINMNLFPDDFNTYDSYAEALLAIGEKDKSIEYYKKSLKLNPGNKYGIKALNDLGVNTDELTKPAKVSAAYLKQLEGTYLSTNQPNWVRLINFKVDNGVLSGTDNGYTYKLIPMGDGKFINPDDGATLLFDTKDKNEITLTLFGKISLKKIKVSTGPTINLQAFAGTYLPSPTDSQMTTMDIIENENKLFRYIADAAPENRAIELIYVTENTFFYSDRSGRSIEFIVTKNNKVSACILRRTDGRFTLTKQKK